MDNNIVQEAIKYFAFTKAPAWRNLAGPEGDEYFIGPILLDGITIADEPDGASCLYKDVKMFKVNHDGRKLLEAADGKTMLVNIAKKLKMEETESHAAMFYVYLGMCGYLRNYVNVRVFEKSEKIEGRMIRENES